jgi:hypothetical protein
MSLNRRRDPRARTSGVYSLCWHHNGGGAHSVQGEATDLSASGIRVRSAAAIEPGTQVFIEGPGRSVKGYCIVRHCTPTDGIHALGLEFSADAKASVLSMGSEDLDHYEFMQINPKASQEVVHRVFRLMAARFHPDNPATGDLEKFLALNRAYDVLSDSERRAHYDASREQREVAPDPIFSTGTFVNGIEGEVNRRLGILAMLYNRRRTNASEPGISLWDVERKMSFPREYLDFAVWYLKAKGYLTMGDNSDLTLTAAGVDYVEANAGQNATLEKLLHVGSRGVMDSTGSRDHSERPNEPFRLRAAESRVESDTEK